MTLDVNVNEGLIDWVFSMRNKKERELNPALVVDSNP